MLSEVFNKDAIKHIKSWMHGADKQGIYWCMYAYIATNIIICPYTLELATAISVIQQLSQLSDNHRRGNSRNSLQPHTHGSKPGTLYKSRSWPKKPKSPSVAIVPSNEFGILGKKLRPHSADMCSHCSNATLGSMYKALKRCIIAV